MYTNSMILNPIQKKSTFQLENKALVFRKPIYSKSPISRTFTDNRPTFSAGLIKDFIPISLTVPHNNQINKLNQIKPVNTLNMKSIQINPNNKINVSSSQVINNPMPNKVPILTPKISNSSIITNNNIINNQPVITNNLKPVSVINMNNSIPTIIANPVQNINQNIQSNIPTIIAKPVQNINQNIPIMAPTTVPNTIQKVISIPNQNQNTISVPNTITNVLTSPNSFLIPSEKLNLNEFELLGEIGKGSFGKIYKVRWKVNQKLFALKNELVDDMEGINTRLSRGKAMRDFVQSTGCTGVVNIYGYHLIRQGNEYHYFELMDLCDTDFEKQIKMRANYLSYFTEAELNNIMKQLISTLSFLQKRHITHRDIKPQNILIANGQYKLCDFGDIRVMQRDGFVVQRIRGSELYMSPILFNGLRQGVQTIQHNTYKSDVFSLGMCLFYAACLSFNGPVEIREVVNMNIKQQILNKYLGTRYSQKFIKFLFLMLLTNENDRPDFVLLEDAMLKYGL